METARDATQQLSLEELLEAFEEAGVYCLPLKGVLDVYKRQCLVLPARKNMAACMFLLIRQLFINLRERCLQAAER